MLPKSNEISGGKRGTVAKLWKQYTQPIILNDPHEIPDSVKEPYLNKPQNSNHTIGTSEDICYYTGDTEKRIKERNKLFEPPTRPRTISEEDAKIRKKAKIISEYLPFKLSTISTSFSSDTESKS